ncbi:unnamed protein product [Paramecium pentaurelia]|uniref:Transmembrane protein n=1 Tax=Paramecium pentaurelia TaxID=43138 RepID=A0A8S1WCA4_9CILI|nr:unnamed protein product [Paramecium pentaurelia]
MQPKFQNLVLVTSVKFMVSFWKSTQLFKAIGVQIHDCYHHILNLDRKDKIQELELPPYEFFCEKTNHQLQIFSLWQYLAHVVGINILLFLLSNRRYRIIEQTISFESQTSSY